MLKGFSLALTLYLAASAGAMAQSSAGGATIQGTVKDATGGVIPGAKLTFTHIETGFPDDQRHQPGWLLRDSARADRQV